MGDQKEYFDGVMFVHHDEKSKYWRESTSNVYYIHV